MQMHKSSFYLLVQRLLLVLILFSFTRLLFLIFNFSYFSESAFSDIVAGFFYGLRFDITAIVIGNLPVIIMHLFPLPFFYSRIWGSIVKTLFVIINFFLLILNCMDVGLFRFSGKRATSDVIKIMAFGEDFMNTVPKMILDYWYVLILLFGMLYILIRLYPSSKTQLSKPDIFSRFMKNNGWRKGLVAFLFFALTFIGFRGGLQFKPLSIISASRYGSAKETALILNTPFTFFKSFGKSTLQKVQFMPEQEAEKISPVIHLPSKDASFRKLNVVVLILESFGSEYVGCLNNGKGYTPFLDSLSKHGLWCTNAFANGKRSIEGIPAITSGIPALISEPFITSAYSSNSITTLAGLLHEKGYSSVFFHGGTNGTMGFDNFSKLAGYDHYFGRKEYANDDDFDGNWGIYDEPFLQRCAVEMNAMKEPFCTTIFTLSSHHPFAIPERHKKDFPEGTLPIHKAIGYADFSLKQFFKSVSSMPWYQNTLFVLTADHTALSEKEFYQTRPGMYAVPVLYFLPGDSLAGDYNDFTQHIDIIPSVMDFLHYDQPYFAFGKSVFDTASSGYSISYLNESYQYLSQGYSFVLDSVSKNSFLPVAKVQGKLISQPTEESLKQRTEAFIQNFNNAMIENRMTYQLYNEKTAIHH